jgi:putative Holliday junction resolvase
MPPRYNGSMPLPPASSQDQLRQEPRRAILAIDYGRKRIGLAVSDGPELGARPLAILPRTNRRDDVTRLRELCRQHSVGRIVVGWPIRLDGTPGAMAGEAEQFATRLRKQLGLPVELVDERLSSWEAEQLVGTTKPREKASLGKRKTLDDIAAALVLRDYLSRSARGAQG